MSEYGVIVKVVAFLLWVNMLPPLAHLIWEDRFKWPVDCGATWLDGRDILGPHKTYRGILFSLFGSLFFVHILPIGWRFILFGTSLALGGDLITSFIKRRLNLPAGERVPGMDHFLESLMPTVFFGKYLPSYTSVGIAALDWWQMTVIISLFILISSVASLIWAKANYHTSFNDSPKIIRATTRARRWRACHLPLARYHTFFNFENFIYYRIVIALFFKSIGLYRQGVRNALDITVRTDDLFFENLPQEFDGFRIMLLTDLHLDGIPELPDRIIEKIKEIEVDLCLMGGDLRMEVYGPAAPCLRGLRRLVKNINAKHGILGVLGNHDCIEMVPDLEEAGVVMLVNDSWHIENDGAQIWIAGIDDPHFYKVHDLQAAFRTVKPGGFTILLSHSPEAYKEAAAFQPAIYLCGHTHGGQIRLQGQKPIFTNSRAPRFTADGPWQYKGMHGFTSRGVGSSGVPLRFNCSAEINIFNLRKK
jgi:predicted MPP superfamily phosphohydrolase